MYSKIISQADFGVIVSLTEVKTQCRVTHEMDDSYLESLIPVACEMAQSYSGRLLTVGSVSSVIDSGDSVVQFPFGEVTEVTELVLDGVVSTDFEFEPITQKITINTPYSVAKATYTCGFVNVPRVVKQAILLTISTMYDARSDFVAGLSVAKLPVTSERLLDTVKFYGI